MLSISIRGWSNCGKTNLLISLIGCINAVLFPVRQFWIVPISGELWLSLSLARALSIIIAFGPILTCLCRIYTVFPLQFCDGKLFIFKFI